MDTPVIKMIMITVFLDTKEPITIDVLEKYNLKRHFRLTTPFVIIHHIYGMTSVLGLH